MKLYNLSFEVCILYRGFQTFLITTHTEKCSLPYDLAHTDTVEVRLTEYHA